MLHINENEFIHICQESNSMADAARKLNMHFNTFRKYAIKLGCYQPNQSHKGIKIGNYNTRIKTEDILLGKYPNYHTYKLKIRLLSEGYLEDKCQMCGWHGKRADSKFSTCELHHKDGNPHNHELSNLILLCPNCHSLTDNYRSKNRATDLKKSD